MKIASLDLLATLVAVAESSNLIEASRKLGLSQPAVTAHLQRLERSAPYPLFTYQGKRKVLTRFGQSVYESARAGLQNLDQGINEVVQAYAAPENLTLRVGCRREIFTVVARNFRFPGRVEFFALSNHKAVTRVLDRSIDIAVSYERPDTPDIVAKKIFSFGCRLVVHRSWLPRGMTELTLEWASSREFLCKVPSLAYRREAPLQREWLRSQGIDPATLTPRMLCEDWRLLVHLVEAAAGYCVIPANNDTTSPDVLGVDLPASVLPKVPHYALFHRELRRIPAFQKLLAQAET